MIITVVLADCPLSIVPPIVQLLRQAHIIQGLMDREGWQRTVGKVISRTQVLEA